MPRTTLNPPQSEAWLAMKPGHTVTLAFGRGVGKSWFVRQACYHLIAQWEYQTRETASDEIVGIRIVFLMPTFKQFRDVHSRLMMDELEGKYASLGGKVDRTTFTVTFPGGSIIQVFPASDHGSQRGRGIRCDVVVIDEADDVDSDTYDGVITPWFSEPWSLKIKLASGTPKRGRHGLLYRLFDTGRRGAKARAGKSPDLTDKQIAAYSKFFSIHATYRDAPGNVDQDTVEQARVTMPPDTFSREWECNFDSGEGMIYPFDDDFHVRKVPKNFRFTDEFICVDHGFQDPGVFLHVGIIGHGKDAIAWIVGEYYETQQPNSYWNSLAKGLVSKGITTFYCDPSRPDRITDLCELGANAVGADNDILAGIARVADLVFIREGEDEVRRARLFVDPSCTKTIEEFGKYRRKKRADGTFEEKPEDKNNHAMDAIRYGLIMRFGRLSRGKHIAEGR